MKNKIVIAVDGHSSCGKSTLAKDIARTCHLTYIDTGAMYRAITLWVMQQQLMDDPSALIQKIGDVELDFHFDKKMNVSSVWLNGKNVESQIRGLAVSQNVSKISAIAEVRSCLVRLQRKMGDKGNVIVDGRDIGTTVFPGADLKIFMTASVEIRAKRRFDELKAKGEEVSIEEIVDNVQQRDYIDENREVSPLRKASEAKVLDNSRLTREQQLNRALEWIEEIK